MRSPLLIIHLIISLSLVGLILIQSGKGGLGKAFGDTVYRSKRGAERIIFRATIVLAALFFVTSLLNMIIK